MIEIRKTETYAKWFARLRDADVRGRILARLDRMALGNPGDARPVGEGVMEMRIDHGPGYRIYYVNRHKSVIVLLAGGDKRRQVRDIQRAIKLSKLV